MSRRPDVRTDASHDGGDFLRAMTAASRARVEAARATCAERELRAAALATPLPPRLTLSAQGFDVIAEIKLRSPAVGALRGGDEDLAARAAAYAVAGAAAVSVLTEPARFDGQLGHLQRVTQALAGRIPAMRKDFLVDPYQMYEARLAGAGGALLILRMLTRAQLEALLASAAELGLFVLLEAFDAADLAQARELIDAHGSQQSLLVGINCRDLTTLQVVPGRLEALAPLLPSGVPRVAESGVMTSDDAARLATCGYDLALIGSALMRADDAAGLVRAMLDAGRSASARRCG